jgi:hypothetical protein
VNDFDELIGTDVPGAERTRLLAVHEALVEAGPPPELPETLRDVPQPGKVSTLRQQTTPRKLALLAAAFLIAVAVFTIGFATGKKATDTAKPVETLQLSGTPSAPRAKATLDVQREVSGNVPMTLEVSGLPRSTSEYYTVWLVRHGQTVGSCGSFVISKPTRTATLKFTAPYSLKKGDTWEVTRQAYGRYYRGSTTVLQPA